MGLLDVVLNPLKDYVSLSDLLLLIGENTQNPLYDICLYLQSVKFGEAVTPYKINQDFALYECKDFIKNMDGLNAVSSIIDDIANHLKQDESDRKLVVQSLMGLNEICGWQEHIKRYFYQEWQKEYYFKRQDLLAFKPLAKCLELNFAMQEEYREIARLRRQLQQVLDGRYLSSLISQNDRLRKENETLQAKLQPNIKKYGTLSEQLEQQTQTETISELQNRIAELESQLASQSENGTPASEPYFDKDDIYTYPPELDMAVRIWHEIYRTDNMPKHFTNHSEKFTQACRNLRFNFTESAIKNRLQKVTTPQSQKNKTKNKNSLN
ncbi:hypothetical protein MBO_05149 [Moraxella bovoculi 237]|uniref:Uncharacterized protein n=1 Tax=Moraxella bovoculi 237 TaxID=743974 RepID=A0A066UM14_9GAMM|nr:hypothetical protein [Moraxella bovoculi]KDN25169.1 hypothetical protein MBO_05149 [Moraxella bovoculi 237]